MAKKPKIIIVEWSHDLIDPSILIAYTADGGRLQLTRVRDDDLPPKRTCHCPLYATPSKLFFTLCRGKLGQIFEAISRCSRTPGMACHNGKRGNSYPQLRNFGHINCHKVILLTFVGPRPVYDDGKEAEGDHKNGNIMDFSLDNLEWVHPSENEWRSTHVLQVLRSKSINPADYTGSQMDHWFALFRALEDLIPLHAQTFTREDYLRFFAMPLDDFKSMLAKFHREDPSDRMAYDFTHHMEC